MSVGDRVSRLRTAHGESLREAAIRTGVSHTTIARIEKGDVSGSFHSTLHKIANGYGVKMDYLLTGRDPKRDFESSVRRLPAEERQRLYFLSPHVRMKMVIDFLLAEYPDEVPLESLAHQAGLNADQFSDVLDHWDEGLPPEIYNRLVEALCRTTGISAHWFQAGTLGVEGPDAMPAEMIQAYVGVMKKALQADITPEMLDMAVDLLLLRRREEQVRRSDSQPGPATRGANAIGRGAGARVSPTRGRTTSPAQADSDYQQWS